MRFLSLMFLLLLGSSPAWATVSISLSGSSEDSTAALESVDSNSISGNIGLTLGQHFMIGLTHRRTYGNRKGFRRLEDGNGDFARYEPFEGRDQNITNSADITLIPYNGVVSPFIFGGVARRDYTTTTDYAGLRHRYTQTLFPIPNYGAGLAIRLGMGFELKVTQTFTPGLKTEIINAETGEEKSHKVMDRYTQLWLGYKI